MQASVSTKHIPDYTVLIGSSDLSTIRVDYEKAIQNLTDIMIDSERFLFMARVIYDACDTDNSGSIDVLVIEEFVRTCMKGH